MKQEGFKVCAYNYTYTTEISCVRTYEIAFRRNKDWGDTNFPIAVKEYYSKQVSREILKLLPATNLLPSSPEFF